MARIAGLLLLAPMAAAAGANTQQSPCPALIDSLLCSEGVGTPCSAYVGQCLAQAQTNHPECCAPAFVTLNYVSAGLTLVTSDLIDLQHCELSAGCVANPALCSGNELSLYDSTANRCANQQAQPQLLTGPSCATGLECDFTISLCNMSTWPQYCSPDSSCSVDLLLYQYCDSQMHYEPKVCQPGKYCSRKHRFNATSVSKDCPEDKYCILGTETPHDCGLMVKCKEGSSNPVQFGPFIYMIILDLCLYFFMRSRGKAQVKAQSSVIGKKGHAAFGVAGVRSNRPPSDGGIGLTSERTDLDAMEASTSSSKSAAHQISSTSSTYHLVRGFTKARGRIFSLDFKFDRLGLILPNGNAILQSVSARVKPGAVTAIMGPSGAGKTTLLNTLMGKVDPSFKQTGELRINGKIKNMKEFRSVIGFVPQEDIMMRELTVRDNIEFSGRVRLPPSWTSEEISKHVDAVLDALALAHVQHTRIGDEKTRGVSGGQRKRVNIGIEVVACPVALYLDEPTSGLDSTAALEVTEALKQIAHSTGITVAMVIHQPRYEIWAALDEVLFLAPGGRTVFLGNLADVEGYFARPGLGYMPSLRDNPADFYMDRIAEKGDQFVEQWKVYAADLDAKADLIAAGGLGAGIGYGGGRTLAKAVVSKALGNDTENPMRASATSKDGGDRASMLAALSGGLADNEGNGVFVPGLGPDERVSRLSEYGHTIVRQLTTDSAVLQHRLTIGSGVNQGLHALQDEGRVVRAEDLAEVLRAAGVFGDVDVQAKLLIEAYDTSRTGVLSSAELSKLLVQVARDERGAPFWRQCGMALGRSLKQQLNRPVSIGIELGTVSFAGALMGFAAKNPYAGILLPPYTLLSPANQVVLVPMSAMFVGMAVGLSAAPTGVDSFGSEQVVYWREASVGHSKFAYFLGKTVSNFPRILVGALHFCGWYLILAETILAPMQLFEIVVGLFFAVYGLSCAVSMVLPIATANLVAVVLALIVPVFGGFVRNLKLGVKQMTYSWWANEAFFSYSIMPYDDIFLTEKTAHVWSYKLNNTGRDFAMMFLIGLLYRALAYAAMVGLNREKQN